MSRLTLSTLFVMPLLGPLCLISPAHAALLSTPDARLTPFSANAPKLLAYSPAVRQQPPSGALGAIRTHIPPAQPVPDAASTPTEVLPTGDAPAQMSAEGAAISAAMKARAANAEALLSPQAWRPASNDVWRQPAAPVPAAVPAEPSAMAIAPAPAVKRSSNVVRRKSNGRGTYKAINGYRPMHPPIDRMTAPVVVAPALPAPPAVSVSMADPALSLPVTEPIAVVPAIEVAAIVPVASVVASSTPVPGFWARYWAALSAPYREAAAARQARLALPEPISRDTIQAVEAAEMTAVAESPRPTASFEPSPPQVALMPDAVAAPALAPQAARSLDALIEPVAAPQPVPVVVAEPALVIPSLSAVKAAPPAEPAMIEMPPVAVPATTLPPVVIVAEQPVIANPAVKALLTPPAKVVLKQWRLEGGQPIDAQLQAWAEASGWKLDWRLDKTWLPPADVFYEGSFDVVIEKIITGLHAEGESIRLTLWSGNRYAEVVHADVK